MKISDKMRFFFYLTVQLIILLLIGQEYLSYSVDSYVANRPPCDQSLALKERIQYMNLTDQKNMEAFRNINKRIRNSKIFELVK